MSAAKQRPAAAPRRHPDPAKAGEEARQLPVGWRWKRLGEAATVNPRSFDAPPTDEDLVSFVPMASVEAGSGRMDVSLARPWKEIKKGYTPFQDGDVLFAKITPCMENGKAALATGLTGGRAAGSTEFHVVRSTGATEPKFVMHFLLQESFRRAARAQMKGTAGQLRVPGDFMESAEIPLPPLAEQRRIVAEIEKQFTRLEAGVAALKRVQSNLNRYRAAVLKAACEGPWPATKLAECVESMKNGLYKARDAYADDGVACLRMYNIEAGKIVWKEIKRMKLTRDEIRDYQLIPGDLLVNRVNSRELVGKAAPIPEGLETCVYESKNIRVRLNRKLANAKYIGFTMSVYGQAHFNRNAQQVVGMASISQPQIGALEIPLPPLAEQKRIVAEVERRLSVVEELSALVTANLQRAARLRQAVLQKAFEGKLC